MEEIFDSTDLFNFSNYYNNLSDFTQIEDLETIMSSEENDQTTSSPIILDDPLEDETIQTTSNLTNNSEEKNKNNNNNENCTSLDKSKSLQVTRKRRYVVIKKIKKKMPTITFQTPVDENGNPRELTEMEIRKRVRERNRINAIRSRKRKRDIVNKLEKESQDLKQRQNELSLQLKEMKHTNKCLKEQSKRIKQLVLQSFSSNGIQSNDFLEISKRTFENIGNFDHCQTNEQQKQEEKDNEQKKLEQKFDFSSFLQEGIGTSCFWHNSLSRRCFIYNQDFEGSFEFIEYQTRKISIRTDIDHTLGASALLIIFTICLIFSFVKLFYQNRFIKFRFLKLFFLQNFLKQNLLQTIPNTSS
ncbi:activating transcription factor-2 [Anaeramoeba flamelloides]|uniref:Activating transcription factor-2 n=1 Tax=Anaeramoeba flamelloides TaxID=1746091 RepID=A0ABQ8XN39_9EUKA|nr:activating transcription factor-2 [Anaeramoeba flamelloides]